jgi:hypothetical protein
MSFSGCAPRLVAPTGEADAPHSADAPPTERAAFVPAVLAFEAQLALWDGRAVDVTWGGATFPSALLLTLGDADWDPLDPYSCTSCVTVVPLTRRTRALDDRGVRHPAAAPDPEAPVETTCDAFDLPDRWSPRALAAEDWAFGLTLTLDADQQRAMTRAGVGSGQAAAALGGWWSVPVLPPGERVVSSWANVAYALDADGVAGEALTRDAVLAAAPPGGLPDALYLAGPPVLIPLAE